MGKVEGLFGSGQNPLRREKPHTERPAGACQAKFPPMPSEQAEVQLAIGKPEAALASAAAGLQAVEKTGGAPLEAELYRSATRIGPAMSCGQR